MPFCTADLLDANEARLADGSLRVATPLFRNFGGRNKFMGRITTLSTFEDNSRVREILAESGAGRVLVIDGKASLRRALLGDQLADLARCNAWEGVVINGCIRDSAVIARVDLGVRALATHPRKTEKNGLGERDLPLNFADVEFIPGEWLYADEDGILVSAAALT
ncbi:ribonuclease E activity regulator RraA [Rhodocyclus tenuis]|uniref:4-hydroxy-4-methyl-2-oxoglutarate aldolase n=2 Tax=Rhodocyclus TaxID=1064 RepID=A0A6L5JWF5_RHOTE|nr:ribonuclease E activity regulator RraA [Rhodocyclus gracilis]MQY51703.1 ribonuclease E activity regulator RraA [Rhodocyclus gracilis]NJA89036.1 ribonuclease E activity regulator RraA [Rhodocyclus gracilis]